MTRSDTTLAIVLAMLASPSIHAATTSMSKISSAEEFQKGICTQTIVTSAGEVMLGSKFVKVDIGDISIWSTATVGATTYIGTGNRGKIYEVNGTKAAESFDTGTFVVTAMSSTPEGDVFAATLPNGKLFVKRKGAPWELFMELPDPYIWALLATSDGHLLVATGPRGRLFRMATKPQGAPPAAEVLFDAPDDHLLCLAESPAPNPSWYCGTALNGLVYKIASTGKADVIIDLDEQEARALVWHDGTLWIGANKVRKFEPDKFVKQLKRAAESVKAGEDSSGQSSVQELFDGAVYQYDFKNHLNKVWSLGKTYLTHLAITRQGAVVIGTGDEGKLFERRADGTVTLLADFPESQVLRLLTEGVPPSLKAIGTGNAASLYVIQSPEIAEASWISEVRDMKFPARWGLLTWGSHGNLVMSTRSGNTHIPDGGWSSWSTPLTTPSPITSPAARYLQIKAQWTKDPSAILEWVIVYAASENQSPAVTELTVEGQEPDRGYSGKPRESTDLQIKWKAEDADGDELVFTILVQREGESAWIPLSNIPTPKKDFKWDTKSAQDGWYRVKAVASDERMNPATASLSGWKVAGPILVDNDTPVLTELSAGTALPMTIDGMAEDRTSAIARIEYTVSDEAWRVIASVDGIYDERKEAFRIILSDLPRGSHVVHVRAFDALGNVTARHITVQIK